MRGAVAWGSEWWLQRRLGERVWVLYCVGAYWLWMVCEGRAGEAFVPLRHRRRPSRRALARRAAARATGVTLPCSAPTRLYLSIKDGSRGSSRAGEEQAPSTPICVNIGAGGGIRARARRRSGPRRHGGSGGRPPFRQPARDGSGFLFHISLPSSNHFGQPCLHPQPPLLPLFMPGQISARAHAPPMDRPRGERGGAPRPGGRRDAAAASSADFRLPPPPPTRSFQARRSRLPRPVLAFAPSNSIAHARAHAT